MISENTVKPEKMKSSDCGTAAGGGEVRHSLHCVSDQRDGFTSWLRAEFAAANALIDRLCHHLRFVGDPGDYDFVISYIQQRRVSWNPVLHLQQFFPCTEIMRELEQIEWRRQQRVESVDHNVNANAPTPIVGNMEENRVVKEREEGGFGNDVRKSNDKGPTDVQNASVKGSPENSRNPGGANSPCTESQLNDVKVEETLNYEGCYLPVAKNNHSILNQNEESLTTSPKTFHTVKTNDGKTVNVAEGWNIYRELDQAENPKLISPVNDLRATGQIPVIDATYDIPYSGDYEPNRTELFPTHRSESRFKWSHEEDLHLISAWLNTDKGIATNQKPKAYWTRVSDYYSNRKLDAWVRRGPKCCKSRWSIVTWSVYKFVSCYEEASKKTREQSADDVTRKAHQLYHNNAGKDFLLEHAWRALRSESKWRDRYLKVADTNTTEDSRGSAKKCKINESTDSDDSEANLQFVNTKEEESKMKLKRDKRKRKIEGEYLLAKKYDLLSNLIAQSGSLTSAEMMFKSKLVEDLLNQ